jgi:hypothetical protein
MVRWRRRVSKLKEADLSYRARVAEKPLDILRQAQEEAARIFNPPYAFFTREVSDSHGSTVTEVILMREDADDFVFDPQVNHFRYIYFAGDQFLGLSDPLTEPAQLGQIDRPTSV